MRYGRLLLMVAGSTSCASAGTSPGSIAAPTERIVATDSENVYRTTVPPNAKVSIAVPPSRAFEALKAAYEELGIPPGTLDPATGRVGNTNFWKSRKLADQPISTYLNCGDTLTGPAADVYRVYMSIISAVRPDGKGGSELETAFNAQARNMDGASGDRVACGSTGRLEERIQKIILAKTSATPQ